MRLLRRSSNGELKFTVDLKEEDTIPPYAILSHTWGADDEEVTFEDLTNGTGMDKDGYRKIKFCAEQARQDKLQYLWVDTCCIDKVNKGELANAINSMFRWYRNATRCYVYLSDVSNATSGIDRITSTLPVWESDFRKSRWFTRGWTLQELIAPVLVEFFSKEWEKLGDKASLRQQIHQITGIPDLALQGTPLTNFDVEERLSWNVYRHTTLEEDRVYSMLGIFDVYISPFYSEGANRAFERLMDEINKRTRCIKDLRHTDPRDDKARIENTKGGLLKDSYRWVFDNAEFQLWREHKQNQLLWIKGDPGKGKTMLLCGIIDELKKSKANLSFYFCQATDSRINNATAALRGLLYMLVDQQPSLVSHVRRKYDHAGKALFEDTNAWVALVEILTNVLQDPRLGTTYLVIDALDECEVDLSKLLQFIAQQLGSSRVKWIISSRNWPGIEKELENAGHKVKLSLELNAESVSAAVTLFIKQKVSQLTHKNKYDDKTRDIVLHHLASSANNTFLWVALVCQNLQKTPRWNVLKKLNTFPPGLDSLYKRMIEQIDRSDDSLLCKQILALAAIVYQPVTIYELVSLVEALKDMRSDLESVREIIGLCGSFLTLQGETIYFVHQSAKDFIFTKAFDEVFPAGIEEIHWVICLRSLELMSTTLQRDIYGLKAFGSTVEEVKQPDPDPLARSRYSCIYWVDHLCESNPYSSIRHGGYLQDSGDIDLFLQEKYLYWIEALSLCRRISKGVVSIKKLWLLVQGREKATTLTELVYDALRFVMTHKVAIESNPLQVYMSALLFSPTGSLIGKMFHYEKPEWITVKPTMGESWSACLQTLEGHNRPVLSVAFSHDSTRLASASGDSTIKIWEVSSGTCLQTLEGHSEIVNSVSYSHDSTWLASASGDSTIKIWDTRSGACLQSLKGHNTAVHLVVFSLDSTRLASGAGTTTVKIWDTSSGVCLQTLNGFNGSAVAFSHDSFRLASASAFNTIKIWDASSGVCLQTLKGHSSEIYSVDFSHDSTWLASASYDNTIKIWDANSGVCLQILCDHSGSVFSVAFSSDSTRLASASFDMTVKIWDASSGTCLKTLEGHSQYVRSVAYSHDSNRLASASADCTVKIWDTSSSAYPQTIGGHSKSVCSVVFSRDSTRMASASDDRTVKIWDVSSGVCLRTLKGHSRSVSSVAFSHDSAHLASASMDGIVKIWETSSGLSLQSLEGHNHPVHSVAYSHDSTRLASGAHDRNVKIWDASSGACLRTLDNDSDPVCSVIFSHDSTLLASVSLNSTIKIWDARSGTHLQTLEGHNGPILSVAFSPDSVRLASTSVDRTIMIWEAKRGDCLQTLVSNKRVDSISFDVTGSYLHSEIGMIAIGAVPVSDVTNVLQALHPQSHSGAVSLDRTWITYNTQNTLWVPSEYRPSSVAVLGNNIGIGVGSGRVWICSFLTSQTQDPIYH